MARVTNFGISALSKKNKKYAYRAEIMCNKDIGELCVKTNDGDTMSYNYFTRLRSSINTISLTAKHYGLIGDIFNIIPEETDLPDIITDTKTVNCGVTLEDELKDESYTGVILYADVFGVIANKNMLTRLSIDKIYATYTIVVTFANDKTETVTKTSTIQDMMTDNITFSEPFKCISISDIAISLDSNITDYVLIVNHILAFVNK